jgi:hypothetical protein
VGILGAGVRLALFFASGWKKVVLEAVGTHDISFMLFLDCPIAT